MQDKGFKQNMEINYLMINKMLYNENQGVLSIKCNNIFHEVETLGNIKR